MSFNNESLQAAYSSVKRITLSLNPIVLSEYAVDPTAPVIKTAPAAENTNLDPTAPIINEGEDLPKLNAWVAKHRERLEKLMENIKYTQPVATHDGTIDSLLVDMLSDVIDVWEEQTNDTMDEPVDGNPTDD